MGLTKLSLLLVFIFSSWSFAQELPSSQRRAPGENYEQAYRRYLARNPALLLHDFEPSAHDAAKAFETLDLSRVPQWETEANLLQNFSQVRDEHFMESEVHPELVRRISWLYPDDGCYARAALMRQLFEKWEQVQPNRVFIFGNLEARTSNHPSGVVTWWYHTAPIIRVGAEAYVLDPAIEPTRPVTLKEWVLKQTSDVTTVQLSICAPKTYDPGASCTNPTDDSVSSSTENILLDLEWDRQKQMARDPMRVLGNEPPW